MSLTPIVLPIYYDSAAYWHLYDELPAYFTRPLQPWSTEAEGSTYGHICDDWLWFRSRLHLILEANDVGVESFVLFIIWDTIQDLLRINHEESTFNATYAFLPSSLVHIYASKCE